MKSAISILSPDRANALRASLVDLLVDAVNHGGSVNFVQPMTRDKAEAWWEGALASHRRGERIILAIENGGGVDGSVQLMPASQENQPHRADIGKLLVHSRARRKGFGDELMSAAETEARRLGKTLLTLDTETGSAAERLYVRRGWIKFGLVPGYHRTADGTAFGDCTFFYKTL